MKAWKKFVDFLAVVLILAVLFSAVRWWLSPRQVYQRNREELNAAVATILEAESADGLADHSIGGARLVDYLSTRTDPIIDFSTPSLSTLTPYAGLYYSVNGVPVADESGADLVETEDGWTWTGTGDNRGRTWQIEGNWYGYTAWY
ncbi:MAG: hypothetical protein LUE61_04075 [Clostridiales bacterium]|nr:hypothetical protein [Clostridiales bacterium]